MSKNAAAIIFFLISVFIHAQTDAETGEADGMDAAVLLSPRSSQRELQGEEMAQKPFLFHIAPIFGTVFKLKLSPYI